MYRLLASDFYYDGSSVDVPSFGHSSSSLGRFTPQTQYMLDDMSPDLDQSLGSGLPDNLNVDQWYAYSHE